jgi:hypothetical protein
MIEHRQRIGHAANDVHIWTASASSHSRPRCLNDISDLHITVASPNRKSLKNGEHTWVRTKDPLIKRRYSGPIQLHDPTANCTTNTLKSLMFRRR